MAKRIDKTKISEMSDRYLEYLIFNAGQYLNSNINDKTDFINFIEIGKDKLTISDENETSDNKAIRSILATTMSYLYSSDMPAGPTKEGAILSAIEHLEDLIDNYNCDYKTPLYNAIVEIYDYLSHKIDETYRDFKIVQYRRRRNVDE